ncbi:MBL fold metallo-hydrolase [Yoonia sp.]|uniref:MBL fold metallo-hydrolase n=1 Tax=Yoonia sp. TaxID=2212373 RepID=UPI002E0A59D1|nr:MBL fold metallo-hydrolase [Yoonia sp.]
MADFAPIAGKPLALADDLQLVLAPNPSPMTYLGTNTYIIGRDTLAIIDPGPDDPTHLAALVAVIAGRPVSHILLTHSHLDHSPLAGPLRDRLGAPTYAFGDSHAGRSEIMQQLAGEGLAGGGEGIDHRFAPDHALKDGEVLSGAWGDITTLHTPGHIGNHLCFGWKDAIFTGDHVMGWSSSLVSPPDGDLSDFMSSCTKLQDHDARVYYPGHGAPVTQPAARLAWLIDHRKKREAQIIAALTTKPATPAQITQAVYQDLAPGLMYAAERNVFAHLVDLYKRGKISAAPQLATGALFALRA